ncbi:hypothetical protein ACLKA7_004305 [Drosophila subpalustris]
MDDEVCRVCSSKNSKLVNIFVKREPEEDEEELPSPAEMLDECTDCRINQNDPLSKQICESCLIAAKYVCCVCRSSSITRMDIFEKRQRQEGIFSMAEMMDECLGTKTANSKSVTSRICLSCVLTVRETFKFKRKYKQNNLLLTDSKQAEEFILPDNNVIANINLELEDNSSQDWKSTECDVKSEVKENDEELTTGYKAREISGNVKTEWNEEQEEEFNPRLFDETLDTDESQLSDIIITKDACQNELLPGCSNSSQKPSVKNKFACDICGRILPSLGRLVTHKRNHSNTIEQPYQCTHCPNKYTRKKCLEIHLSKHGINNETKSEIVYQCSYCPRTFALSISLRNHQRIHTTEGPFKCPECPKCFASNLGLLDHSRIHIVKDNHVQGWESGESFAKSEVDSEKSLKKVDNKEQKEFVACELDEATLDTDESLMNQESEEGEEELPSPAEMLDECTDCRINQNDPLPKQICESCLLAAKYVCCVCRSSSITRMDIFEKRQRQEGIFSMAEMMDECLGTKTANSKSVNTRICLSCLLTVRDTFKFKRKYERNNLLLTDNMQAEGLILPDNNIDVNIKLEMEEIHVENEIKEDDDVLTTVVDVKEERNVEQEEVFIVWEMDEETKDADD